MTRCRRPLLLFVLLVGAGTVQAEPPLEPRAAGPQRFSLFPAPPALGATNPRTGLEAARAESLVRLPGDADSVFTLGGPGPSGQPRVRVALEVNEAILKVLAPEPNVESSDLRGRPGGGWKPIDAIGRPYQLRFGARLIW